MLSAFASCRTHVEIPKAMLKHVLAKPLCAGAAVVLLLAPLPALGKGIQVSQKRRPGNLWSHQEELAAFQGPGDQVVP